MVQLGKTDVKFELKSKARRAVLNADPTEVPGLVLLGVSGGSQYVMGGLGVLGLLLIDTYFITVTNRSVYVHRGTRLSNSPDKLIHVIPLAQADGLVARVKWGKRQSVLRLRFPGRKRPTRMNVSYHSRDELERFVTKFPEGAVRA
ncbi:hypothetical protein [Streptomyces sp. NBC_00102]|uniref:hypothetical protein n=1 Tax=Streptomyces sp. NBC_00102 TaxID=2975652 RepID=UPI0022554C34|nr:hypothetical protein [Streptomyces sp. NBC_00102]MCX5401066.1 hypothetical protein [Streptomyces sp. NBC_00102]